MQNFMKIIKKFQVKLIVVSRCAPTKYHFIYLQKNFLNKNVDVLVEKPSNTLDLNKANELINLAEKNSRILT